MPSPFPGMDPYTERADVWLELHNRLMVYACDALQPLLPPHYVARLELRIYTEPGPEARITPLRVPDLEVVRTTPRAGAGPVATLERPSIETGNGYWIEAIPVERKEAFVAIRTVPDSHLVTCVELLSPSNKRSGAGRDEYERKQLELLSPEVNLVEIDLLRAGTHTVAVPLELIDHLGPYDYLACVFRTGRPTGFWVTAWTLRDAFPPIPVPLSPGDDELGLDLNELYDRAYDNAACSKLNDYGKPVKPRLAKPDAAWVDELLRGSGLRGDAPL